jgi:hypothetical protein
VCILLEVQKVQKLVRREDAISTTFFHSFCGKNAAQQKGKRFPGDLV